MAVGKQRAKLVSFLWNKFVGINWDGLNLRSRKFLLLIRRRKSVLEFSAEHVKSEDDFWSFDECELYWTVQRRSNAAWGTHALSKRGTQRSIDCYESIGLKTRLSQRRFPLYSEATCLRPHALFPYCECYHFRLYIVCIHFSLNLNVSFLLSRCFFFHSCFKVTL